MPLVGFEPTIAASKRAKTVHVLDRSATVTGKPTLIPLYYRLREHSSCLPVLDFIGIYFILGMDISSIIRFFELAAVCYLFLEVLL
jgi:hypothetical protein